MDAYIHTVIIKLTWISKGIYIYIFIYIMLYNNKKRGGRGGGGWRMISERTVHLISDGFDLSKRRSLPPFLPNCQQRDSVCAVSRWIRSCVCARGSRAGPGSRLSSRNFSAYLYIDKESSERERERERVCVCVEYIQ